MVIDAVPDSVFVDSAFVMTVRVVDDAGNAVVGYTGEIVIELEAGSLAGKLAGSTTAVAERGVASFRALRIDRAGNGYRLRAMAPKDGLPPVGSNPMRVVHPEADLELKTTVSNERPLVGDTVTYTLTVTNHGPGRAVDVGITTPLPKRMKLISAEATVGAYSSSDGVWRIPAIDNQKSVTLSIKAIAQE
jgi:uncharacterized repeat protein (TIGR01451 family)